MVERFEDIYTFNLAGNYKTELNRLLGSIEQAQAGFKQLQSEIVAAGATFGQVKSKTKGAADAIEDVAAASEKAADSLPAQKQLATASRTLATAYNQLVTETNQLNAARAVESAALIQAKRNSDPRIIDLRAETRALKAVTKLLEEEAFQRARSSIAKQQGIELDAKGARAVSTRAAAEERAKKAIDAANVALETRNILAAQGRDARGNIAPEPLSIRGTLTSAGEAAARRQADEKIEKALIRQKRDELLNANSAYVAQQKVLKSTGREFGDLANQTDKSESAFNRVSFTFRRLIGIMAVFTVARTVVSGFNSMIRGAIEFNAAIETSRVGLAGLIAASANIRSPGGDLLNLDNQILQAQNLAIDQMSRLRKDALLTAASYDELARAFSSAVAPGIQANLTLDQIRKVTIDISQAATGLGLSQDQLAEEIRSLFAGTISARNTRIATALGISNEDINNAKKLGNLFEFLEKRFAAISKTGKLLLNTFTGQLSNAADAFKQLLATSSQPLFEQLKAGLKDVQDAIFSTAKDAVIFDPNILKAFTGLFQGLANGVKGIRTAFKSVDAAGFAGTLATVGQTLGLIASALAQALATFLNVSAPTVNILASLVNILAQVSIAVQKISGAFGGFVGGVVVSLAKTLFLVSAFGKLATVIKGIGPFLKKNLALTVATEAAAAGTATAATGLAKTLTGLTRTLGRLAFPILAVGAAVALVDGALSALGIDFSVGSFIGDLFDSISNKIFGVSEDVKGLKEELSQPVTNPLGIVENDFRDLKSGITETIQTLREELVKLKAESSASTFSLKLSSNPAQILQTRASLDNEFFNSDKIKASSDAIEILRGQLLQLSKQKEKFSKDFLNRSSEADAIRKAAEDTFAREEASLRDQRFNLRTEKKALENEKPGTLVESFLRNTNLERVNALISSSQKNSLKLKEDLNKELARANALQSEQTTLLGNEKSLTGQLLALEKDRNTAISELNKKKAVSVTSLANRDVEETLVRLDALSDSLAQADAALGGMKNSSREALDAALKAAEVDKQAIDFRRKEAFFLEDIAQLERERAGFRGQDSEEAAIAVSRLSAAIGFRKEELATEREIAAKTRERLQLESRLADLRATGTAGQGVGVGLANFARDNASFFNTGEKFGQDFANGITSFAGDSIKQSIAAAFDPNQNFDLQQAAGNFLLDLGAGLATDLLKNLLSQLITSLGINLASSLGGLSAGAAAVSGAATQLGTTGASVATGIGSAAASMASIVSGLIVSLNATIAAARGGEAASTTLKVVGSVAGPAKGGPTAKIPRYRSSDISRSHAGAPGFARGGRPLGMDPRDTIPAFLRAGEWVIRPEAVGFYGDRLFDMLNRMKLNPSALRGISSGTPMKMPSLKRSFATGGPVVASQGTRGVPTVLQFHDEQTLDRAIAAGPDSMLRFARQRRAGYRAALGLDGAS